MMRGQLASYYVDRRTVGRDRWCLMSKSSWSAGARSVGRAVHARFGAVVVAVVVSSVGILGLIPRPAVGQAPSRSSAQPNIVLVLTDDQRFDSLWAMPNVQRLMGHGITFRRAFVTNSLCCPSRVTILTGGLSHTTGVYTNVYTDNSPYGGFQAFHASGGESGTIAVALHDAGYRTALIGKYLNDYAGPYVPPGWDRWAVFAGLANGGAYYNYKMFVSNGVNGVRERYESDPPDYSTTVIQHKAIRFLRSTPVDVPLFLEVTPYAPHFVAIGAPRDVGTFKGSVTDADLPPSFNEPDVSDKPAYIRNGDLSSATGTETRYQRQYEALQAVDRMLGKIIDELRASQRLHNTLIVFMSDNGVQFGEHRWIYKLVPYEESIRVPFVVRFPPMTDPRAGTTSTAMIANVDIAPTFAELAGISGFSGVGTVDGVSFAPLLNGTAAAIRHDLLLEHIDYPVMYHVPSYCGLRTDRWMYTRYGGGFQELYRLSTDPYEERNVASKGRPALHHLRLRTDALCRPRPPGYTWP
jgi:N-acetylglucosamine-6-sulfatase